MKNAPSPKRRPPAAGFEPDLRKGQRATVLGLGRSGVNAANLLARKGFRVFGSDASPRKALGRLAELDRGIPREAGGHTARALEADFIVKSPGLPRDLPLLRRAERLGLPVFSEVEVALAFSPHGRLWAVTGTNGKTTTTALLGTVLRAAGRRVVVAGNIGLAVSDAVRRVRPGDELVVELSSYQLEDSTRLAPRAACVLNLTPDHLDHHGSMASYARAKARVFQGQGRGDACVFNRDDARVRRLARACRSRRLWFGRGAGAHARIRGGRIELEGRALRPPALPGGHNLENAAAAALMARSGGVPLAAVQRGFDRFRGVEHRIEPAGRVRGVACVNDSKATNVDSTVVALRSFDGRGRRLLVILGGRDKGSPYAPLAPFLRRSAKAVLTIGEAAGRIGRELRGTAPILPCRDLRRAVRKGLELGGKGDVLLLSPACASFDQFKDFEERGRVFKRLVREAATR